MKILIYGYKSFIAKEFIEYLNINNILYFTSKIKNININERHNILDEIKSINPTNCISFIGRTNGMIKNIFINSIDYLEHNDYENIRDNCIAPQILSDVCKNLKIHFTYIGTGCIFNYKENHELTSKNIEDVYKFKEDDLPNYFGSSYSIIKGYTEQNLKQYNNVLILRLRMPIIYKKNPRNLITKLLNYKKILSKYNSVSVLPELFPYLIKLMKIQHTGILNFTNPGVISHNDILNIYNKYSDIKVKWDVMEEDSDLASKRCNNYLDTTKLENMFPDIKNINDSIEYIVKNYVSP